MSAHILLTSSHSVAIATVVCAIPLMALSRAVICSGLDGYRVLCRHKLISKLSHIIDDSGNTIPLRIAVQ